MSTAREQILSSVRAGRGGVLLVAAIAEFEEEVGDRDIHRADLVASTA
jgi:hypothetical protein